MLTAQEIIDSINLALKSPNFGRSLVKKFLLRLTPSDIEQALESNFDPLKAAIQEYRMADDNVRPWVVLLLKTFWRQVSYYLTSVPRVLKLMLRSNPALKDKLNDRRFLDYLNLNIKRAYNFLYEYIWPPPVDILCKHCGQKFPYDVLLCIWMDYDAQGERDRVVVCPRCYERNLKQKWGEEKALELSSNRVRF
ncbi:MAG: hypothetical protein QXR87_03380 [Candidatus Hadarchaeales archaeon]